MLKIIIYKEIADNIRNLRFTIGSLLVIVVSFICVVILTSLYTNEVKDYNQRIIMQDKAISEFAHTNRLGAIVSPQIPPSKFHPVVLGVDQSVEIKNYNNNPLDSTFPPFDYIIVVTIMLSLLAIIFSYNAISGETEDGTLKLMLSNSVSRSIILTGKWIGGIICLSIPFIVSLLLIAIYLTISPMVSWGSYHWLSFALLGAVSILFISVFYLIGLLVSCFTKNSTLSMLISLFVWVVFILVIPNISPYLAAQLYKVPSINKIEKETNRLGGIERDELGRKLSKAVFDKYINQYGEVVAKLQRLNNKELQSFLVENPEYVEVVSSLRKEVEEAWSEANKIQKEKIDLIKNDLQSKSNKQVSLAKNIAAISPYSCFVYIATDITGTGLNKSEYNKQQLTEYSKVFSEYVENKVKLVKEQDLSFNSESFIDLSDRPKFSYKEELISSKFATTLPYFLILIFFNGLLIALAYYRFSKYDVR